MPVARTIPPGPFIGTAGWTIPAQFRDRFDPEGSHLARYASRFTAVEINSTFYRSHREATYRRWSETVPEGFGFSVKIPKAITHEHRLRNAEPMLIPFLEEVSNLGQRLRVLLVQLPPSAAFIPEVAVEFFETLRGITDLGVVCEPRHPSWFSPDAADLLEESRVARVAADPLRAVGGDLPGGYRGLVYYRLHGAPRVYYSAYDEESIEHLVERVGGELLAGRETWCIFDNTALGAATGNALDILNGTRLQ